VSKGRLTVCPTPIGNLSDITLRSLEALRDGDLVAAEDTRRVRILLERHGITAKTVSLHDRNERSAVRSLVERVAAGEHAVLVSDAGTPLISDPGFLLVRACIEEGLEVEVLPGPTAVTTALILSGLPSDSFRFTGFLPRRRSDFERLIDETRDTLVAFESPRRIGASLELLAEIDPSRRVAVCRELTKLHEETVRGTASELAKHFAGEPPKGEITVVIGPGEAAAVDSRVALETVREMIDLGIKPRSAAKLVARLSGLKTNDLYRGVGGD
jgi:16S rRNA (cytidine1402-2'-O)-methyltransferase